MANGMKNRKLFLKKRNTQLAVECLDLFTFTFLFCFFFFVSIRCRRIIAKKIGIEHRIRDAKNYESERRPKIKQQGNYLNHIQFLFISLRCVCVCASVDAQGEILFIDLFVLVRNERTVVMDDFVCQKMIYFNENTVCLCSRCHHFNYNLPQNIRELCR